MEYEKMLDRAYSALPEKSLEAAARFEIPKARGHIQGNKTVISNFHAIVSVLNRPIEHVLKYILKELATPGELKNKYLVLGTKIPASRINEKIMQYAHSFVLCKECKKPDTKIVKEGGYTYMKCMACGSKAHVSARF